MLVHLNTLPGQGHLESWTASRSFINQFNLEMTVAADYWSPDDPALTDYWAARRRKHRPPPGQHTVRWIAVIRTSSALALMGNRAPRASGGREVSKSSWPTPGIPGRVTGGGGPP